jgi:hypothetical protein
MQLLVLFLEGTLPKTGQPVIIMSKTQMLWCSTSTPSKLPTTTIMIFKFTQIGYGPVSTGTAWGWKRTMREGYGDPSLLKTTLGILGLSEDTHVPGFGIHETYLYGLGNQNEICGASGGPEEFVNYSQGLLELSCKNNNLYSFFQNYSKASFYFVTSVIVVGVVVSFLLILKKSMMTLSFIAVPCVALIATYVAAKAGISRYSFPTYPSFLILIAAMLQRLFLNRKRSFQMRSSPSSSNKKNV